MNNTIFTLLSIIDAVLDVLKDPRNVNMLVRKKNDDVAFSGEISALFLIIDRASKTGTNFIIGRYQDVDIVLTDLEVSVRHCTVSISDIDVPVLHEQSTNDTIINDKRCIHQSFEIQNGMRIDIRDTEFDIRVPWRDNLSRTTSMKREERMKEESELLSSLHPRNQRPSIRPWWKPSDSTRSLILSSTASSWEEVNCAKSRSYVKIISSSP